MTGREGTKTETSEAVELLPCPFFGSPDSEMQPLLVQDKHGPTVICIGCSAIGASRQKPCDAVTAWNIRAALSAPPVGQNVERMRAAPSRFGQQAKWWNSISVTHRAAIQRDVCYGLEEAFNAGWKAALAAALSVAIGAGEVVGYQLLMFNGQWTRTLYDRADAEQAVAQTDNYIREMRPVFLTPPSASIPADVERLPVARIHEQINEGGAWRACSGCQESVDGYVSERDYPYSKAFRCQPGGGCSECGGIGVVWEAPGYWDGLWDEPIAEHNAVRLSTPQATDAPSVTDGERRS